MVRANRVAGMPESPLTGLVGGKKAFWLRQHYDLVMGCREVLGDDLTCHLFCMQPGTPEAMGKRGPDRRWKGASMKQDFQAERLSLRLDMLQAELGELRQRQMELESLFNRFVESTGDQVARALIIPLLRNVLRFEGDLPARLDPVAIDALLNSAKKSLSLH